MVSEKTIAPTSENSETTETGNEASGDVYTVTVRGLTLNIATSVLDDLDLMDDLCLISEGNPFPIGRAIRRITGDKYLEVRKVLTDPETGKVTASDASTFFLEIFQQIDPNYPSS